ncbi:AN1-type zinc finger protein YOR052C [Kluyveromyces marxianus]|uniref:AN1-type zinc finger protein YOR052C n=2 Tax=Kluyveromyces marxianus TaxID=4911 RepID=W0T7E4_KLUMD|nr:uncharacterized protein KLMA_30252 [Kluyveromyces marxianus DMKU3-1042]QGN15262.1 AN1-type zinc finger protein YOR052C [Kluyveromyces marxianus]BAO39547.1 AN1-type zinc finger protein YOR052C [Kluyveromyces marxianus DMKU3-1042]BAP71039.1 AN1-type zinc finger protein YOR052C [Kluyveromyces marxianus]
MSEIVEKECKMEVDESCVANNGNGKVATQSRVGKKDIKKKKKKDRCCFEKCNSAAVKFIGDCNFCEGHFCSKHRLLENHQCQGLKSCKDQMHQRNADKLHKEQPIIPKIHI